MQHCNFVFSSVVHTTELSGLSRTETLRLTSTAVTPSPPEAAPKLEAFARNIVAPHFADDPAAVDVVTLAYSLHFPEKINGN